MEEAKARGIIRGYRVIPVGYGINDYEVIGGDVSLKFPNACGWRSCPPSYATPFIIQIDYRHTAAAQARAILKITRRWANRKFSPYYHGHPDVGYEIIFGPPYYP